MLTLLLPSLLVAGGAFAKFTLVGVNQVPLLPSSAPGNRPDSFIFVVHEHNLEMTRQHLHCLSYWGDLPPVVLIDNSPNFEALEEFGGGQNRVQFPLKDRSGRPIFSFTSDKLRSELLIIPLTVRLDFPSFQNLVVALAQSWGVSHYFMTLSQSFSTVEKRLNDSIKAHSGGKPWGFVGLNYDVFAALSTEAFARVRWDPNYGMNYWTDCDMYQRLQRAGYAYINLNSVGVTLAQLGTEADPEHAFFVLHAPFVVKGFRRDTTLASAVKLAQGVARAKRPSSKAWHGLNRFDDQVRSIKDERGTQYHQLKWGSRSGGFLKPPTGLCHGDLMRAEMNGDASDPPILFPGNGSAPGARGTDPAASSSAPVREQVVLEVGRSGVERRLGPGGEVLVTRGPQHDHRGSQTATIAYAEAKRRGYVGEKMGPRSGARDVSNLVVEETEDPKVAYARAMRDKQQEYNAAGRLATRAPQQSRSRLAKQRPAAGIDRNPG